MATFHIMSGNADERAKIAAGRLNRQHFSCSKCEVSIEKKPLGVKPRRASRRLRSWRRSLRANNADAGFPAHDVGARVSRDRQFGIAAM
jgi:hypothetical protein